MAALAKDRTPPTEYAGPGAHEAGYSATYDVIASDIIYRGAFVSVNAAGDVGPTVAVTQKAIGYAEEQKDNSGGAAGDKKVRVRVASRIIHAVGSATKAHIGNLVYASDDQTLSLAATSNQEVGRIVGLTDDGTPIIQVRSIDAAI